MTRTPRASLLLVTLLAAVATAAGGVAGQQRDTVKAGARPAQRKPAAPRADSANPRVTPRDLVGADDPRCDDLCQRERMMDSLYGKDRERLPAAPARTPPKRP